MNGINAVSAKTLNAHLTPDIGASDCATYVNRGDLPYDYEDLGATEEELRVKFSATGEHEFYTISQWRASGAETLTNGYWDWVMSCIRQDDDVY